MIKYENKLVNKKFHVSIFVYKQGAKSNDIVMINQNIVTHKRHKETEGCHV